MALISVKYVDDLELVVVDMPGMGGAGVRVLLTQPEAERLQAGLKVALARTIQTTPAVARKRSTK